MTSSYSNIWKRFLFSNQSTIYNNEKIEYKLQLYEKSNNNKNNEKLVEQMLIENLDYVMIILFLLFYMMKKNIFY